MELAIFQLIFDRIISKTIAVFFTLEMTERESKILLPELQSLQNEAYNHSPNRAHVNIFFKSLSDTSIKKILRLRMFFLNDFNIPVACYKNKNETKRLKKLKSALHLMIES